MTLLAIVLAMASTALAFPVRTALPTHSRAGRSVPRAFVALAVGSMVLGLWSWLDPRRFALAVVLGLVVVAVTRLMSRRRAAQAADRTADQVLAVCDAMASDLVAGQPPAASLGRAAEEWPDFAPVAVAGQMGADVPGQLRELARRPGAGQLRTLAATWQVAHDTGAGLAAALNQAADAIRAERRTARLVAAELAAAHATARMLAALPAGVLLLGAGLGGDPVGFLTGTTPGLVCLAVGLGLSLAGLQWLDRIADRVLRR
jgi:tight adherence protein B